MNFFIQRKRAKNDLIAIKTQFINTNNRVWFHISYDTHNIIYADRILVREDTAQ